MKQQQVKTKYKREPTSGLRIQNYVKSKEFSRLPTTLKSKLSSAYSTLDEKVTAVTELLTTVSDKCLKTVNKNRKRQNILKNYFDSDCYKKRKQPQKLAKLMSSKPNDIHIRNSFYQTKRTYQHMIKTRKRDQKEIKHNQLTNLKPTEIKKKWDMLKSITKTKNQNDPAEGITLKRWKTYFESFGTNGEGNDPIPDSYNQNSLKITPSQMN